MKKEIIKLKRINTCPFTYITAKKIETGEILEIQKVNIQTNKKEMIFQDKNYKKIINKKDLTKE